MSVFSIGGKVLLLTAFLASNKVFGTTYETYIEFREGPKEILFIGPVNDNSVNEVVTGEKYKSAQILRIRSSGGQVAAGIRFGNWIWSKQLTVIVDGYCISTCANYIFTSGRKKIILEGALVAWHGGALQHDFRQKNSGNNNYEKLVCDQAKYFNLVGVSEYLTRAGQEPVFVGASWSFSVDEMKWFGLENVTAPPDYGSGKYVERWLAESKFPINIKALVLNQNIKEHKDDFDKYCK